MFLKSILAFMTMVSLAQAAPQNQNKKKKVKLTPEQQMLVMKADQIFMNTPPSRLPSTNMEMKMQSSVNGPAPAKKK